MNRRLPAEWEPQSAIQFTFPHQDSDWAPYLEDVFPCFLDCIELISQTQLVLIVCQDIPMVKAMIKQANWDHLRFAAIPSNDTWARDHGAITLLVDQQPVLLDFFFNGWGLKFPADKDNLITSRLWEKGILRAKEKWLTGLVLEGGAIESDGKGTILTTKQCLASPNRNPHLSLDQLLETLKAWLGAERILVLENGHLAGDDTDAHIDTLARLCDEQTIAYVHCDDPADEHYEGLKKMEAELSDLKTMEGHAYRLIPLPLPDPCLDPLDGHRLPATYANFLITNDLVIVPTYQQPKDQVAIEQLKSCFVNRKVVGVDALAVIRQHGSIHCLTMQYPTGVVL
ncbi:MAG: agmatine deiminase family protein [Saprospiraceae bacterium]